LEVNFIVERNAKVVSDLKMSRLWICDICELTSMDCYGVEFIEAHHKTPVHLKNSSGKVELEEFALLCPNCHTAIHILMTSGANEYSILRRSMRQRLKMPG
jgi:putative restriction endonuclease